ncbi:hypothetical protein FPRO05_12058 [Fusarium proliferatum]|uniref:Uncharacterized protein n=1 Tax=Gibberella intermedia TaxID=948311 RepID=A0A365N4W5_GIBIN|nr:hypothetical protein FPRO05_12058 [Fusarium proliferatum]
MSSQNPNPLVKGLATIHEALGRLGYRLQEIVTPNRKQTTMPVLSPHHSDSDLRLRSDPAISEMRRHSLTLEDNTASHGSLEAAHPASSAGPRTILDRRWAQGRDVPTLLIDTQILTRMDFEYEMTQGTNQGYQVRQVTRECGDRLAPVTNMSVFQSHNTMVSAHPHDNGHKRKRPRSDDDELAEAGTDYVSGTKRAKLSNS